MADVVPALVGEVRAFRQAHPEIRYVDLICLDFARLAPRQPENGEASG